MNNALLSGITGLRINQQFLDVIGNNLANSNTVGYKTKSLNFSSILSQTLSPGSAPTGSRGGVNPFQIGRGVTVGSTDTNFIQGSILNTGRNLDLAIQGRGFFVVNDGTRNLYSRAGAFTLDADDFIVDSSTGFRLQSIAGQDIQIESDLISPPMASSDVQVSGNLPANVTGPLTEILQTIAPFEEHTPATVTSVAGTPDFTFAAQETLSLKVDRGATQTVTIPAGTHTPQALATMIGDAITGISVTVNGSNLVLASDRAGEQSVLHILPTPGATQLFNGSDIGVDFVGTENPATLTSDLNDLSANTTDYVDGATILISGSRPDGTSVSTTFTYGAANDGTTLQEFLDHMAVVFDVQPGGGFYSFDAATGNVDWTAYASGEASFTITIRDDPASPQPGSTNWNNHAFDALVDGTDPDTAPLTAIIHDSTGQPHVLTLTFERQDDGTWNLIPTVDASEGTVTSPSITGIAFASDGTLLAVPNTQINIQWNGVAGAQDLDVDLGTAGNAGSITQFGADAPNVRGLADGYPAGVLDGFEVRTDGQIQGFFTNGQITQIDQLGLATFANPEGLRAAGDNMWIEAPNSGAAVIAGAQQGAAGSIISSAQEGSNVDIAEEFVKLIEAQRSFQASARIITTTDEVLAELVNLAR